MALKNKVRFSVLAALVGTAMTFSACGDDSGNNTPPEESGGTTSTGGKTGSGGKATGGSSGSGSGGTENPDSGSGGSEESGGTTSTGGKGSGGKGSGGDGSGGTVPEGGCEGDDGCYACDPADGKSEQFLNHCTDVGCIPYDNDDVPAQKDLPPIP